MNHTISGFSTLTLFTPISSLCGLFPQNTPYKLITLNSNTLQLIINV